MGGYKPLKISGMTTGLVQNREEYILPNDAYPVLENAYIFREKIQKKKGAQLVGRLQRTIPTENWFRNEVTGNASGTIVNADNANPGKVTTSAPHGLVNGDKVYITGIQGATGYNRTLWTITVVDALNFTIGADATNFGTYVNGTGSYIVNPWAFTFKVQRGYITAADNANPGKVTTSVPHGLSTGDTVVISNVVGAVGYNNTKFTITVVDATNFTIGVNAAAFGAYISGGTFISNRNSSEVNSQLVPGSLVFTINSGPPLIYTDNGDGTLTGSIAGSSGFIDYDNWVVYLENALAAGFTTTVTLKYYPVLPVMGIRTRELNSIDNEMTIVFDQKYAYRFLSTAFEEFIPGTVWTGSDANFFWTTNFGVGNANNSNKIFWATNFTGPGGDPIRYTDGTTWIDFKPPIDQNITPTRLQQCLAMVPFRGRLVVFNTYEGTNLTNPLPYPNRIRWSAIGTPFYEANAIVAAGYFNADAWIDSIRGQGGFLDIPTTEAIVSVGFVRDNLVIYCERSTWQLRYTGRSISPFQLEKINSELGSYSTFGSVQFDTSLVGIGDKGVVECDSFKSDRIDIKIPDLVFNFNNDNSGPERIQGIRNFENRLAFWTYSYRPDNPFSQIYPNRRLVYNYENDSWAIFLDSYTALGYFQAVDSRKWNESVYPWSDGDFVWFDTPAGFPEVVGGNQQGYVMYLDAKTTNDAGLTITAITGNPPSPTAITCPNHNLTSGQYVKLSGIIGDYSSLNGQKFYVWPLDANRFEIKQANWTENTPGNYIGGGQVHVVDNFTVKSKLFNFADEGESIQMGYIDVLMDTTYDSGIPSDPDNGACVLNIYVNYATTPITVTFAPPDSFFNQTLPTTHPNQVFGWRKAWQRLFCPVYANFIQLEWTYNDTQLLAEASDYSITIDGQILWIRKAGKQLSYQIDYN